MIGKVGRGANVAGLLRYLFGPGRANEHTDPHLVATWDGRISDLEPGGRFGTLAQLLEQPLESSARPPARPVWHCSLRTAPADRRLGDDEWARVMHNVLQRTGFATEGDEGGCRWVAVRHADDHVHLVVTLARQDGGRVSTSNDFYRLGEACRWAEGEFGLMATPPRDRTAGKRTTRAETEKAARQGMGPPSRVQLQREVRVAAAQADGAGNFLQRLKSAGLLVRPRYSQRNPEQITGYSVALPGHRTAAGLPVWYGGSKLAPDLSWTRLTQKWMNSAAGRPAGLPDQTADLLQLVAHHREGRRGGPLTNAAATFERARSEPFHKAPLQRPAALARSVARDLLRAGRDVEGSGELTRTLETLINLTTAVARLRATQGRTTQRDAALTAAHTLRGRLPDARRAGRALAAMPAHSLSPAAARRH